MAPVFFSAFVVEQLERGDFFTEGITKRCLFASVHDAVLYCLNHHGATSFPRFEPSGVSVLCLCRTQFGWSVKNEVAAC